MSAEAADRVSRPGAAPGARGARLRRRLVVLQLAVMAIIVASGAAILIAGQLAPLFQQRTP